jgi:hypothetical protein
MAQAALSISFGRCFHNTLSVRQGAGRKACSRSSNAVANDPMSKLPAQLFCSQAPACTRCDCRRGALLRSGAHFSIPSEGEAAADSGKRGESSGLVPAVQRTPQHEFYRAPLGQ